MSDPRDERERIQRIRERQIRARDPGEKDRAFQRKISARYKKPKLTFWDVIRDIPGRWVGMFVGGVVGILAVILVSHLIESDTVWCEAGKYIVVLVCVLMGMGLGRVMDWRDEDHDALVKQGRK
jgi:hypothetical protein